MKLKNKKAIVTGANRSIGAAIAIQLAKEGADVVISYRSDKAGADNTVKAILSLGRQAKAIYADFTESAQLTVFYQEAAAFLGSVDILVNNAGGYNTNSFLELSEADFEKCFTIGVQAPMKLMQLASHTMVQAKKPGAIINISSISGVRAYPNRVAHVTAKAALNALTASSAIDLGPYGIRVNAIAPGSTPYDPTDVDPVVWGDVKKIPLQRAGFAEDIAKAALYLASDDSSWVTGQVLIVDGGQSLSF